jgi:drug/metabolite transporter (DMT)-like permease
MRPVAGVLFACLAGVFFGGLNITMRRGLDRAGDVDAAAVVIASFGLVTTAGAATALARDGADPAELWPFLLIGVVVPGLSQLAVVHAVRAAGASRAGILFGMAPLFSALIAIAAFDEPLRRPLVVGTLLVVAGGVALAWDRNRPVDYRAYGAVLAVGVAVLFGLRDNAARAAGEDVSADPLAQSAAIMLGATLLLGLNLLRQRDAVARTRRALAPFASSGVVAALAQLTLFEALDRARVTVVAPLVGTGVLWTVVFAAIFLGKSEVVGRRLVLVALLVLAGGALVAATR